MAISTETIRKITIQGQGQQSLEALAASLAKVTAAQERVTTASTAAVQAQEKLAKIEADASASQEKKAKAAAQAVAAQDRLTTAQERLTKAELAAQGVTDKSASKQLSSAKAYQNQSSALYENVRMQERIEKATTVATNAFNTNTLTNRQGVLVDKNSAEGKAALAERIKDINAHYGNATASSKAFASATSGVSAQLIAMSAGLGPIGVFLAAFGPWGIAAAVGLGVLTSKSIDSIGAFRKFEEEALTLNSMLKSTGFAAGKTAEDIERMATEIGNISEVRKAGIELVKFGNIAGDIFDRTMVAADDLSAAGFGSISSAAAALGKALESPMDGLTRLRRAGIIFSDSQIAMVKNMQETGRLAEAQKYILDELGKKVGGAGAARDQGLAGSYEALGDATQRLLERWGKQIVVGFGLTSMLKGIATELDEINKRSSGYGRIEAIDQRLAELRKSQANPQLFSIDIGLEKSEIRALEKERALRVLEQAEKDIVKAYEADSAALGAHNKAMERSQELTTGVIRDIEKETDALRKNAFERAVEVAIRKGEVDKFKAGVVDEQTIRNAVNTKMATQATEQFIDSTRQQTDSLKIEAVAMGMSVAAAARYKIEQELLARVVASGNTLSAPQRANIKAIADEYGAATGRVEAFKMAEAKRAQVLTGTQGIETARLELSLVGQTTQVQNTLLGQLRIKQQLEQEELRTKIPMDKEHLAFLQQQVAEQEKLNQLKRVQELQNQTDFQTKTQFFSQEDLRVAQAMFQIWGKDWPQHTNDNIALQIKFNDLLGQSRDLLNSAASGLVKDLATGTDLMDALAKGAGTLGSSLIDIGVRRIVDQLMSSFSGDVLGFTTGATAGAAIIGPAIIAAFTTGASEAAVITRSASIGGGLGGVGAPGGEKPGGGGLGGLLGGVLGGVSPLGAFTLVAGIGLSMFSASSAAKKAEEERIERARKAWEAAKEAAADWMTVMRGGSVGELRKQISQAISQARYYIDLSAQARGDMTRNNPEIVDMIDAFNTFNAGVINEFERRLQSTIDSFNSGLGPDSAFAKGARQIIELGDNLSGFIADVNYLIKQSVPGTDYVSTSVTQRDIEDAQRAAQHYALTLLGVVAPLSDVQTQLQGLHGRASELGDVLTRLGMDAGDAATAISQHLTAAITAIKASLEADLVSQINTSTGRGYLNDIADAVAAFATNRADLAAVGGDVVLADQVFMTAVQNTIDGAGLVGSAFADLITQFPQLAGLVHESASAIKAAADQADQAVRVAQDALNGLYTSAVQAVTAAQGTLNEAYNRQSSAIQTTVDRMKSFIAATQQFRDSLLINKQLSPLSPADQLAASRAQLLDIAAKAQGGDEAAQGQLQGAVNSFLDQSKSFNASSEAYYRDFQEVQGILQRAQGSAQTQVDIGQRQLDALNAQVSGLLTINASVVSVADAISGLQGAQATVAELNSSGLLTANDSVLTVAQAIDNLRTALTAQQTANDALSQVTPTPITTPISTLTPTQALINSLYQNDLHRAPDAAGNAYWTAQINAGLSGTSLMRSFVGGALAAGEAVDPAVRAALGMVNGGMVGNGIWNRDSVLARFAGGGNIALAGGEYVTRATSVTPATYGALDYINRTGNAPSNDNKAHFAELGRVISFSSTQQTEALRQEIQELRAEVKRLNDTTRIAATQKPRAAKVA